MSQVIYRSRIRKVRFQVSGTEDVLSESDAPITTYDLFKGGFPYPGGVYDGHLGTTDHKYACQTCFNNKKNCLGHDGHLILNQPVVSPLFLQHIKKWLKLICHKCGSPVVDIDLFARYPASKRLSEASKLAGSGSKTCPICAEEHPSIVRDKERPLMILTRSSTGAEPKKLFPHAIAVILDRISNETVIKMGVDPRSHPRKFILHAIKIPPTTIRPDIKKISSGRSSNNELTTLLQNIIRKNEKLPKTLPPDEEIGEDLTESYFALQDMYYAYVRGSHSKRVITGGGNAPLSSLALRLRGKQGLHRKHQQGKRVRVVARTTIVGDPTLKIDEISIPLKFAKLLQVEEIVQEFNRKRLMINFLNGTKKYPGCSKIIRKRTGTEHGVEDPHSIPELEIGDKILRDMQDNDHVLFNRQPSLLPSAISGMRVQINMDTDNLTIGMNVTSCPFKVQLKDGNRELPIWLVDKTILDKQCNVSPSMKCGNFISRI